MYYNGKKMSSAIINNISLNNRNIRSFNLYGCLCMPCCCLGCSFLILKKIPQEYNNNYRKIVEFYGDRHSCNRLRSLINIELQIFRKSVTQVNDTIDPNLIFSDISIIDIILRNNIKINKIFKGINSSFDLTNNLKQINNEYSVAIWNEYLKNNGNYHIIIYGIIEYLSGIYSEVSEITNSFMENIISDTTLRSEILSHKTFILNI